MAEVIIVGSGLAAACLMHRFNACNVNFEVISEPSLSNSSRVAAGVWNPVVFKRFTKSWMADTVIAEAISFYKSIEQAAGEQWLFERQIIRPLYEEHEQKLWLAKAKNELDDFLEEEIKTLNGTLLGLKMAGAYGIVNKAGNLDIPAFLDFTLQNFKHQIHRQKFEHTRLQLEEKGISYEGKKAKAIVFCEGWLVKDNPLFNWIPLKPAKGEVLTLKANNIDLKKHISNRSTFLFQQQNGTLRCGATYAWDVLNEEPTEACKDQLLRGFAEHSNEHAHVLEHLAGVRPATVDRRPVLGRHPQHHNVYMFNGLGSKGVMLAPYFSKKFVNFYLQQETLPAEVDLRRFIANYEQSKTS